MKKIFIIFIITSILLITIVSSSCFNSGSDQGSEITENIGTEGISGGSEEMSEEKLTDLLDDEGFMDVFNSFYYPDSLIEEAGTVESDENLAYILSEVSENFQKVEQYYKDKKVQSIWSRGLIFEESSGDIEEEFLTSEDDEIPTFKFTYYSNEKDKVVNVLIKGLEENRTQIMIIYWTLQ
ncbi:MAG: hypothetical protein PHQ09_02875 [Actinomycetota bacterium]|nr:hypothetical protein [Actinomycetota bacterium]